MLCVSDRGEFFGIFLFYNTFISSFYILKWQDSGHASEVVRKGVTLPPAGHKQKGLSSFWLVTRGHISPSQTELMKEWKTEKGRGRVGFSFLLSLN